MKAQYRLGVTVAFCIGLFLAFPARVEIVGIDPTAHSSPSVVVTTSSPLSESRRPPSPSPFSSDAFCPSTIVTSSFQPLTSFQFWGKTMNASSTCPTSGLNNQLTLVLALMHCAGKNSARLDSSSVFRWKDISCTPTGGKDSGSKFALGGHDYDYGWFRWSELFDVERGWRTVSASSSASSEPPIRLCLSDKHTWSEHAVLKRCPSSIARMYNSAEYWRLRSLLPLRRRFPLLAQCIVAKWQAEATNEGSAIDATDCGTTPHKAIEPFIGLHIRRGDYKHFCQGLKSNSGKSTYVSAPFRTIRNKTMLSTNWMTGCYQTDDQLKTHILGRVREMWRQLTGSHDDTAVPLVVIATNSPALLKSMREKLGAAVRVRSALELKDHLSEWPEGIVQQDMMSSSPEVKLLAKHQRQQRISVVDWSMVDVQLLALASTMVLNRYSTFSQSAIDVRMITDGSLDGMQLVWW